LGLERLKVGEASDADFEWFNHELTESNYKVENKTTYLPSHNYAEKKFKAIHGMKSIP